MSDERGRPDSRKSRQELLDEIYLLRDVAGERSARIAELCAQLELIQHSWTWRMTRPLRWLGRRIARQGASFSKVLSKSRDRSDSRKSPAPKAGVRGEALQPGPVVGSSGGRNGRRMFVDVTELVLREGRTGVQRVTRQILHALWESQPQGYVVEPVYAGTGQPYRLARRFTAKELGVARRVISEPPMQARPGDLFLGLDHAMEAVREHAGELAAMHEMGIRIWFVCNDTLPLSYPGWFPPEVHGKFKAWFETIAHVGDGIACISRATEADAWHWLDVLGVARRPPLMTGHFHLGSEMGSGICASEITQDQQTMLGRLRDRPSFLIVGTLEPRKGHAQALEAFNQLWDAGLDLVLVLAGLPGWMTEVTQRRVRHHDEFGKRLFWFADANDAMLEQLYKRCTVLLAPSEGEGFGLPLIEAARHGLPILCRDIPVFHEVAGEFATYFSGNEAASLAQAIENWLEALRQGMVPSTAAMPRLTWSESAQQLLDVVLAGHTMSFGE